MGKPSPASVAPDDAYALSDQNQVQLPYYDNDAPELPVLDNMQNDDLPPLYDEAAETGGSLNAPLLDNSTASGSYLPVLESHAAGVSKPFRHDEEVDYYLDSALDEDPTLLERRVRSWAAIAPRPYVRIHGHHRERRHHDKKREDKKVTDFDIKVDLTPYLCPNGGLQQAKYGLDTVENGEKVRRGTSLRRRAPGVGKRNAGRIELGAVEKPNLTQWCHMYCASHAGLKVFRLRRRVVGWDMELLQTYLQSMVRRTNYQGHLEVTFPVYNQDVELWSDCRTNRWRLTKWIYGLFCVTMLWILTWPYLFFRTKRFETASAVWHFSTPNSDGTKNYVTLSENQWYNMWGRALGKAVLTKRQGTLDQQDLLAAEGAPPTFDTGHSSVDGALGFVAASVNAMNQVNRQVGWGYDEF